MSKKMTWSEFTDSFAKRRNKHLGLTENSIRTFNGSHSIIEVECDKHGRFNIEARMVPNAMFGCKQCANEYRKHVTSKTLDTFIKQSKEIFGDSMSYEKARYVNSYTPIILTCKTHGDFSMRPKDHINKMEGCPLCRRSKLENMVRNELDKIGTLYIEQKRFDWLGKMSLDFYIPSLRLGIECQGKQHFGYGGWSGNFDFKALFSRDCTKYRLCRENGVELIYLSDSVFDYDKSLGDIYNDDNLFTDVGVMIENIRLREK